jgi:anaerobic selenocysteine-containing dehydrogenase
MTDKNEWLKTNCGRMDQGGCRLLVKVEGNRIITVKGDPEGTLNHGYTCIKGRANADRLTHPDRLTTPLKRVGARGEGKWEPLSWDEAMATIAGAFNQVKTQFGARAVAFCQGMPKGLEHFALIRLANTFGSPNVVGPQNVCHMPREISGLHTCGFYPVVDYNHPAKCVLLWGGNPNDTNEEGVIHTQLENRIKEGTQLIVVDPRRTSMAAKARYWLQLRPGSDVALALCMLHVIISDEVYDHDFTAKWTYGFDELRSYAANFEPEKYEDITWIDAGLVREAARLYAQSKPAALQWGNGIEQGAHNFHTCRSLLCLMAVTGNLDTPGGNIDAGQPAVLGMADFVRAELMPAKYKEMISYSHGVIPRFMVVPPPYLRQAILHGQPYPVKAAYVHASNPAVGWSDSRETVAALKALDFLAVSDVFMTPTAALADVVLPAATHFEFNDIGHYGLGHGFILARPKLVDPPEGCRPDIRIINDLANALGLGEYWWNDHEKMLDELLAPSGLSYAQVAEQGMLKAPVRFRKYEAKGFRTPTGKVELALSKADQLKLPAIPQFEGLPFEDDPERPFILISSKCAEFLCSSNRRIARLRKVRPRPLISIHPETARSLGLNDGDCVAIETSTGSILQYAHLWDGLHPRVVSADYGWWFPEMGSDNFYGWDISNLNLLTSSKTAGQAFGTPHMRSLPCSLRKVRPEEQPHIQTEW